jgi:hypothetical protein
MTRDGERVRRWSLTMLGLQLHRENGPRSRSNFVPLLEWIREAAQ